MRDEGRGRHASSPWGPSLGKSSAGISEGSEQRENIKESFFQKSGSVLGFKDLLRYGKGMRGDPGRGGPLMRKSQKRCVFNKE